MAIEYTGNSITDYLKSIGKDASYQARSVLAAEKGIQNYTGSAEQNTQLLSSLRSTQTTPQQTSTTPSLTNISQNTSSQNQDLLSKALAELSKRLQSNVTNVNQISDTPSLPTDATTTSYPSIDVTSANSVNDLITAEQLRLNEERQAAQNTLSKAGLGGTGSSLQEQLLTGYQTNVPKADYATALKTAQEEYGVITGLSDYKLQSQKVATMKGAIESLDLQRQNELDTASNRQASMTSINAEKNAINERYDSQRVKLVGDYNIEAAILASQSNYLSEANKLVDNAVQAYTADITAEITRFNNLYSMASDWVSSLDAAEKSILDDAKKELEKKKEEETKRLTGVGNLMVEYNQYGAGVNINDSYKEALKKIQPYYSGANRTTQIVGSAETGYSLIDTKTGEVVKNIESILGGGSGNGNEKIMSVWEIQQYSKLYGWTPPSGFTRKEIDDFVKANPNATPAELESGAKQALLGINNKTGETIEINSDYFKSLYSQDELYKIAEKNNLVNYWSPFSSHDVDRLLKSIDSTIEQYRNQGYSDEEILENIYNNVINK